MMEIDKELYKLLEKEIHSDISPVGIDAKKTHILILEKLIKIEDSLKRLESDVIELKNQKV